MSSFWFNNGLEEDFSICTEKCTFLQLLEKETVVRLLCNCPECNPLRKFYHPRLVLAGNAKEELEVMLVSENVQTLEDVCDHVKKIA